MAQRAIYDAPERLAMSSMGAKRTATGSSNSALGLALPSAGRRWHFGRAELHLGLGGEASRVEERMPHIGRWSL
jgi:hypothetical protein